MTWQPGHHIVVRGGEWRVLRSTPFSDCAALDLAPLRSGCSRTLLVPFDRPRVAATPRLRVVSRRRWAHAVTSSITASFPYGGLQFCPATIRLLPYQIEPALAMIRHGAVRLLIADDVGLGKTVEAGLIVREITLSSKFARTLIVTPSSLREQWAHELRALFGLPVIDADAAWLQRASRALPRDVNPWSLPGIYLTSMDFVKRPEVLRPLEDLRWDLFVLDEAHAATPRSDRRAALDAVASRARRVVLLTATPHSGDDGQFTALCGLGAIGGRPPLVVYSRSRADTAVAGLPVRSTILPVRPTADEHLMHRLLEAYTARVWREAAGRRDGASELLVTVLRKRALSSARSLALSLRRRLLLLSPVVPPAQLTLPLADDDVPEDDANGSLGAKGLDDTEDERAIVLALADAADRAAASESKLRVLLRLIRRVREPAIVFSEYRDTVEWLHETLSRDGQRVVILHGGMTRDQRRTALSTFGAGGVLLVATDAASEGLNLHTACRTVVHFELPWTPSRLHQRCGRVNRIGQTRRVHEIALVANDTAEQLVLEPLVRRAARSGAFAQASIVRQLTEARVAAHLLAGAPLTPEPGSDTPVAQMPLMDEALAEVRRLERDRRLHRRPPRRTNASSSGTEIPVTCINRRGEDRHLLTCIVELTLGDQVGGVVTREIIAVQCDIGTIAWAHDAAVLRTQVARLLDRQQPALSTAIERTLADRLSAVRPLRIASETAGGLRGLDMQRRHRSAARELVQAGLFDRRAMRAAGARAQVSEMLDEDERGHRATGAIDGRFEIRAVLCGGLR